MEKNMSSLGPKSKMFPIGLQEVNVLPSNRNVKRLKYTLIAESELPFTMFFFMLYTKKQKILCIERKSWKNYQKFSYWRTKIVKLKLVNMQSTLTAARFVRKVLTLLTIVAAVTEELQVDAAPLVRGPGVRIGHETRESDSRNTHCNTCTITLHQHILHTSTGRLSQRQCRWTQQRSLPEARV